MSSPTKPAIAATPRPRTPTVITLLVAATFTVILNETIMINAIPRLTRDFDVHRERLDSGSPPSFLLDHGIGGSP